LVDSEEKQSGKLPPRLCKLRISKHQKHHHSYGSCYWCR